MLKSMNNFGGVFHGKVRSHSLASSHLSDIVVDVNRKSHVSLFAVCSGILFLIFMLYFALA